MHGLRERYGAVDVLARDEGADAAGWNADELVDGAGEGGGEPGGAHGDEVVAAALDAEDEHVVEGCAGGVV